MAIQFYLTNVGRTAALNATLVGLDLQIKYIAVGDASSGGLYNAAIEAATMTALDNELERYLVNGGEIEPTTHTLRFTVNLNSSITADIYEIGLFDENNVLFAVASSTTTPLVQLINEVITIITFGFSLDDVDNITLMLDVNSPLAVTLMNQHTAHEHPHAQYKRINDDTERLKVANGTDPKDAVNKEQLDAEATARANADTNLQNTKAALNGDNTQRFKASTALYLDEVVNKAQLDSALSATLGSLNLGNKADKNGNSGEFFNVKNGVDSSHAVNKQQLDAEATARSNADTALQNSKAELAGSSTQQFSVADGSTQYHAVNKGQLDDKAELAGSSTQQFSVADGSTQYHAVNKGQLDAVANAIPTLPTLATETILGLVEKATQPELNNGTANVWPDAAILLSGFSQGVDYFKLPQFLGGWMFKWGQHTIGDFNPGVTPTFTTPISGFNNIKTVLVGSTSDAGVGSFVVHRHSFNDTSVTVVPEEWASEAQTNAGYWWLAIGT